MKIFRRKVEELAWVFGVHGLAVRLHRTLRAREDSSALASFYSKLLPPNALAFDLGANTGIYCEALLLAGARVVAVEPNADCLRHVELSYGHRKIELLQAAVGPTNGLADFHVSDGRDDASALADGSSASAQLEVSRKFAVPTLTLDCLIEHYGMPDYIKIDVEGYESAVLRGLSRLPALLSFEFHHLYSEKALLCFDNPLFSSCKFNITDETGAGLKLEQWVGLQEIKKIATQIISSKTYRDIYVRPNS